MTVETFRAGAQYDDWTGTVAADDGDFVQINEWLKDNGYVAEDEFIAGLDVFIGESTVTDEPQPVAVSALVFENARGFAEAEEIINTEMGLPVCKRISVDIPRAEFFALFKRLSITMSRKGMIPVGTQYIYEEKS